MGSFIALLIWVSLAAIGVAVKVAKKNREQSQSAPHRVTMDEILEHLQQESGRPVEQPIVNKPKPKKTAKKAPVVEGERVTSAQPASVEEKPASDEAPSKGVDLDFDPVKMVIYSEIMEPGYEKY